jgi:hypothetical protein
VTSAANTIVTTSLYAIFIDALRLNDYWGKSAFFRRNGWQQEITVLAFAGDGTELWEPVLRLGETLTLSPMLVAA